MKMPFRQNRFNNFKPADKKKSKSLVVTVLILILLFGMISPLRGVFSGVLNYMGQPFWILKDRLSVRLPRFTNYFALKSSLYSENASLKSEVESLKSLSDANEALRIENAELRSILSVRASNDKRIISQILHRPKSSGFDILIIDAGRDDGISVGDLVYKQGNFVLGKIIEIYKDTSKVQLFSYESSETSVLLGEERSLLRAQGEGGQNFSVEFPADINISENDIAMLESRPDSILATVHEIISTPGGLISKAILTSPININQLRFVEVVLDSNKTIVNTENQ